METGSQKHKEDFKSSEVKRLTESAWINTISAEQLRSSLPQLTEIREKAAAETEQKQKELDALNPHGKEDRQKRQDMKVAVERGKRGLAYIDERMEMLKKQIQNHEETAQRELARANFIEEKFPQLLDALAVEPEAEEVKA